MLELTSNTVSDDDILSTFEQLITQYLAVPAKYRRSAVNELAMLLKSLKTSEGFTATK